MSGYATHDVSELIGLSPAQVRHYAHRGLLHPARGTRGEYRFSFQDVVLLRTAKGLLDARVSARKAYRVLLKLRDELAAARPLTAVRILADGRHVVVREDNSLWNAETGQGHLDFSDVGEPGAVAALAREDSDNALDAEDLDSDDWYNLGLDLEEVDADRAPEAYQRAIALDPNNTDAYVNLGRLQQLHGQIKQAKKLYETALAQMPEHPLALYNLGTLFDELEEYDTAILYYRQALVVPDAHFNLARIYELKGDELAALRHLRRYRQLVDAP
jgi:tetratricopeptide (TPR) repeat protein